MRCGCIEASAGLLAGLAGSALAWHVVAPQSWAEGLALATTFTLALTVGAGRVGRRRERKRAL